MADDNRGTRRGRGRRMPHRTLGRGVRGRGCGGRGTPTIDSPGSDQHMTDAGTAATLPSVPLVVTTPLPSPSTVDPSSSTPAPSPPSVGPSSTRSDARGSTTQKIVIRPGPGNLEMYPPKLTTNEISRIIKQKFNYMWATYGAIDKDTKDVWWGEFKKKFTWNPQDDVEIRKAFYHKGICILKSAMNHIRKGKSKGNWIATHIRAELDEYFANDPEPRKRSAIGRQNQAVDSGASACIGGCISAGDYYDMMSQEMGRPPAVIKMLGKTKKLNSGDWVNGKSREINDTYHEALDQTQARTSREDGSSSSQESSVSVDDNAIYLEVVGGKNKEHVYEQGQLGDHYIASSSRHATHEDVPNAPPEVIHEMRETIARLNQKLAKQIVRERELQAKIDELTTQTQFIFRHFQLQPPVAPPTPPPPPAAKDVRAIDEADHLDDFFANDVTQQDEFPPS